MSREGDEGTMARGHNLCVFTERRIVSRMIIWRIRWRVVWKTNGSRGKEEQAMKRYNGSWSVPDIVREKIPVIFLPKLFLSLNCN